MKQQSCEPYTVKDRHPNAYFKETEYMGHTNHEVNDLTDDFIRKQRRLYALNN